MDLAEPRGSGLHRDSVANACQIATIDRSDLDDLVGVVPPDLMSAVDEGVRGFLGLD